jgi:hypothetical protein
MQKVLQELTDVIGYGNAIDVCRRWGGREIRVPVKVAASDPLALVLGLETARKLVLAFGDQRLQLPSERNALLDLRNAAIWKACIIEGKSHKVVGLEFGLTRQAVSDVLRKMREQGHDACAAMAPA